MQQHGFIMFIKHTKFMAEGVMLESSQSITFSNPSFPKAKQAKKKNLKLTSIGYLFFLTETLFFKIF